jgi:hypothetical protein
VIIRIGCGMYREKCADCAGTGDADGYEKLAAELAATSDVDLLSGIAEIAERIGR